MSLLEALFVHSKGQINPQDSEGNTPLHYAYLNSAGALCKALVFNTAHLGIPNAEGDCIFDLPAPNKKLLYKLICEMGASPVL